MIELMVLVQHSHLDNFLHGPIPSSRGGLYFCLVACRHLFTNVEVTPYSVWLTYPRFG